MSFLKTNKNLHCVMVVFNTCIEFKIWIRSKLYFVNNFKNIILYLVYSITSNWSRVLKRYWKEVNLIYMYISRLSWKRNGHHILVLDLIPMNNKWNIKLDWYTWTYGGVFNKGYGLFLGGGLFFFFFACPCLNKKCLFKVNVPYAYLNVKYTDQ